MNDTRNERRSQKREQKARRKKRGPDYPPTFTLPNRKSEFATVEEEKESKQQTTAEKLEVYKQLLPGLLRKLSKIPDPRNPEKTRHQITVVMLYGILMFIFHLPSRRGGNRDLTGPQLLENLKVLLPELNEMPHQDTLCRLLEEMDVEQIETAYISMLKQLIRKKKFKNLLTGDRYLVAIDGTQKYVMDRCWDERYLRRKNEEGEYHYYAYVVEAVLIFSNGMVLPLLSEFLENSPELEAIENAEKWKQDCELKGFYRLSKRLKKEFPKLKFTLLLDGLYANGPVMSMCFKHKWQFMIVLKEKSLSSLWREANALIGLDKEKANYWWQKWRGRKQSFRWVCNLEYEYGPVNRRKRLVVHVVLCEESWKVIDENNNFIIETARHAWISSEPVTKNNVHQLCNLIARKRWLQENTILKEKRQGYHYEHIFSHDFDAMRGYHYLMHIARMLNEMAFHSVSLTEHVKTVGFREFIKTFKETMIHTGLDKELLIRIAESPGRLRLVTESDWKTKKMAA